jgi:type IV pilus assembly protein PilA
MTHWSREGRPSGRPSLPLVAFQLRRDTADTACMADDVAILDGGFTLVELLVVMVIIAVLAGIAIPTYLNQRTNAEKTAAYSDLRHTAQMVESYAVDHDDSYAGMDGVTETSPQLVDNGFVPTAWTTLTVHATASDFCIEGHRQALPGHLFTYHYSSGVTAMDDGGC